MKDALLKGSLKEFGSQLHYGWEIKKKFSFKISNSFIDDLYNTARQAGAIGGKVLGAGKGDICLFTVTLLFNHLSLMLFNQKVSI